ncbi:hypothetical protein LPJ72_003404 [Coemansia sp. Benny D160-2]|nr:hypothetical protein LPJ72_003404 [Coemansia sp. Benny D160-2]
MPDSPHDIFSLVTPADIRRIRDSAQENFVKLIDKVFDRLLVLKGARDLTKAQTNTKQLLNCIRVLTRLLPFVFELGPDGGDLEDIVLWTSRPRPGSGADYVLGNQLVSAVIDLLFTSGFTVPAATVGEDAVVRYTIWENGIGQTSSLGSSKEHVSNRVEILRLLLVLCSKAMYFPPAGSISLPNRALHTIAYNNNKRMVLCLLCSLINTSLKDRAQGWSIPYRGSAAVDPHDELTQQALHALFVLLDYQIAAAKPDNKDAAAAADNTSDVPESVIDTDADANTPSVLLITETKVGTHNLFRAFIAKLHRTQEFDYLISNIIRLLEEAMRANLSILASVTKQPTRTVMPQEAAVLLWILLENNSSFRDYTVDHNNSLKLFSLLLYFMLSGYTDPAQAGLVRTISNILHYLSEDSKFATRLMQPFDQSILPSTMRIIDVCLTHADFMINTVFTLLSSSKPYLIPVYSNLLLLIRNVSPYLTQTSQPTADKLVSLFDIISSPAFIISEPYHIRWLIYLIEVFDYVIHYRAVDNPRLIYKMVKTRSCFRRLKTFDLATAKSELAALRDKKSKAESTRTIGKSASLLAKPGHTGVGDDPTDALSDASATNQGTSIVSAASERSDIENIERTASPALSDKARGKQPQLEAKAKANPDKPADSQGSIDSNPTPRSSLAKLAVGKKGGGAKMSLQQFQPSEEWVFSWLPDLPLDPILSVLDTLSERIDKIAEAVEKEAESVAAVGTEQLSRQASDNKSSDSHLRQPESADISTKNAIDGFQSHASPVDPTPAILHWLSSDAMVEALPDLEESMPEIRPRLQGMSPALIVWFRSLLWSMVYASGMKPLGIWKNTRVRLFVVKNSQ